MLRWDKTGEGQPARRVALLAMLTAMALVLFVVEQLIPLPVAIPGIKLGLANVVSLFAVYALGPGEAAACLAARILLGNLVCGSVSAMLYSAAGGLCCGAVLCLLVRVIPREQAWVLSILSALAHILGQCAAAAWMLGSALVLVYLPVLLLAAMGTGALTGSVVTVLLRRSALTRLFGKK